MSVNSGETRFGTRRMVLVSFAESYVCQLFTQSTRGDKTKLKTAQITIFCLQNAAGRKTPSCEYSDRIIG